MLEVNKSDATEERKKNTTRLTARTRGEEEEEEVDHGKNMDEDEINEEDVNGDNNSEENENEDDSGEGEKWCKNENMKGKNDNKEQIHVGGENWIIVGEG